MKGKNILILGSVAVAGLLTYLIIKKIKSKNSNAGSSTNKTSGSKEDKAFWQIVDLMRADAKLNNKTFPEKDFLKAVDEQYGDYKAGKAGRYNAGEIYKQGGKVGALMAVKDAWKPSGYISLSDSANTKTWDIFNSLIY
jgi:hypothetical protein